MFPSQISETYPLPDWQDGDGRYYARGWFLSTAFPGVLTLWRVVVCLTCLHSASHWLWLHSRKSTSRGPLLSKKKVIVTLPVLVRTASDFFGGGELRCFHCWLCRLLSGSKWWHHVYSPMTIRGRNAYYSSCYRCKWLRHEAILLIVCPSASWCGTHCAQIFWNCKWSLIVACTELWLMLNWTRICSSVSRRCSWIRPSIRAITSGVIARWVCPGRESSFSDVNLVEW